MTDLERILERLQDPQWSGLVEWHDKVSYDTPEGGVDHPAHLHLTVDGLALVKWFGNRLDLILEVVRK